MDPEKYFDMIIGTWESQKLESEMGLVRHVLTFNQQHQFRLESYFSEAEDGDEQNEEPIAIEGGFEVIGERLFAKQLNKDGPLAFKFYNGGQQMSLKLSGQQPVLFDRQVKTSNEP